ncbi:MAG TPA: phenylalanine--tRNA ligase subunit beta [Candidatus Baltobacteraceae bacterium]|nr:phenylalanine--tRNA ligase subunit beta [Candidatus Baltobacteraceae bacterium]
MRVPIAWLRDYVDLPEDAGEIVARLAALGFPVDDVETRPRLTNVVVGRIAKLERHPNADRLQLCTIDVGEASTLLIATAATNVAQGQTVPVARIGAELAGGLTIAPRKMRGIDSQGMLISAEEIGLPAEWFEDGIMQLEPEIPLGTDAIAYFRLHDPVLDVDVTPNRPDALSVVGLARELAASFGVALREPPTGVRIAGAGDDARVTLETVDCTRFVYQRAGGLTVRPAKSWMRVRLALAGQRPIDNLVDISNFVMLELGQPLHFFDWDRVAGKHLVVRDARDGERFTTLDAQERVLDGKAIVIADGQGPTSLAGIMGGLRSEVVATTTELLIEAASWSGPRIRRASVALKLRTEASSRFEKSLPSALADLGAARAAHLLAAEGGTVFAPHAAGRASAPPAPVRLRRGEVRRLLGFDLGDDELVRALASLGFAVTAETDELAVTPPYWRGDVAIAADVVEEVARVAGYDKVRAEVPAIPPQAIASAAFDREMQLAEIFAALGYDECFSLSLQPAGVAETWRANGVDVPRPVEIRNPLSEDQRFMRFSCAPALLTFAARDHAVRPYRVFELGHVFREGDGASNGAAAPHERVELTALHAGGPSAFARLKEDTLALVRRVTGVDARVERAAFPSLHPGKTAALRVGETIVAYVGVLDPRLARAYDVDETTALATVFVEALPAYAPPRYVAPSRFPALERDLALVVDEAVAAAEVVDAARVEPLVRSVRPFDEYRGPQVGANKKSLALRIVLQSDEATLTDADADAAIARILAALRERVNAEQRA